MVERRASREAEETQVEQLQLHLDCATRVQRVCMISPYPGYDSNTLSTLEVPWAVPAIDCEMHAGRSVVRGPLTFSASLAKRSQGIVNHHIHDFTALTEIPNISSRV